MQVRGAPLIAIVAALGLASVVENKRNTFSSALEAAAFILESITYLRTSRPTAVNLFVATDQLTAVVKSLLNTEGATVSSVCEGYILEAEKLHREDIATNKAIGDFGAKRILEISQRDRVRVLTICNTGSLATAGYGTALGVVRSLQLMGALEHIYALETRPYNQGARLTAFEIVEEGLDGTLITDSMASALMAVKGVDCVVVGADRVTANGDTANKIGTYQLAIAAKYHGVPFFAAVPTTTLDITLPSGDLIPIEQRPPDELTCMFGQRIAPEGIAVWNPSFDVTPCTLITGVITELGVAESRPGLDKDSIIDMPSFLRERGSSRAVEKSVEPQKSGGGVVRLTESDIARFVADTPILRKQVGCVPGEEGAGQLKLEEVGDGNINFVYIVRGPTGTIVVKQALPFVRVVGEAWPLTVERIVFERNALVMQHSLCPEHVPEVYYFDAKRALLAMQYVPPPNIILRKVFIQGLRPSTFATHMGTFCAHTLFGTSMLNMTGSEFRMRVSEWSRNTDLCSITEGLVFSDPYRKGQYNRWTSPQLDAYAEAIQNDIQLKIAVSGLKGAFLGRTQALIHGDLHSGSVMASEGSTFAIDPEFGIYGPMGFDIGAFLGNLLIAYFSQPGHHGDENAAWILEQIRSFYTVFNTEFLCLWGEAAAAGRGELFVSGVLKTAEELDTAQRHFMAQLWCDSIGFAGAKMIRRVLTIAHVADLEEISDVDLRATCEKKVLLMGRKLVLASQEMAMTCSVSSMEILLQHAKELYATNSLPVIWPSGSV